MKNSGDTQKTFDGGVWLQQKFSEVSRQRPGFGLRDFARLLNMEPSAVSQVLSGRRRLTERTLGQVCERLRVKPEVQTILVESLRAGRKMHKSAPEISYSQTASDAFHAVADWHHHAILELTEVFDFNPSPRWIARELGITSTAAKIAIERLIRLGLLVRQGEAVVKTASPMSNFSEGSMAGFTAPAIKEWQRQILKRAWRAIDEGAAGEKDLNISTFAIDPAKLPEAKRRIRQFRREMRALLENGTRSHVYSLGLQLIPLSRKHAGS